jgi:GDP-L-fucose synthase
MNSLAQQRILVTGGGGFLGSHVVEKLREAGCGSVFVARRRDYDLTTEAGADRLFADAAPVELVIHLAGFVGGIGANKARPADFFYRNLMMGALVLDRAFRAGAKKVVAAGAGCGYPETAPLPLREESFWDGFPQAESAPYSLAKRMLHVQSLAYWRQHRFPIVVTIPGNIYGPYDNFDLEDAHVIPALVRKFAEAAPEDASHEPAVGVWGSGRPTRDFVYAGDVAEGILKAAVTYDEPALVNLSSGVESSIREVVDMLAELSGFRGKVAWDTSRPDGQARRVFDVSRAEAELGWRARTPLREGLAQTLAWFRRNAAVARV